MVGVTDKVRGFLDKDLKIFVCGDTAKRPEDLFKNSSMSLLNTIASKRTVFAEPAAEQRGVVSISLDKPVKGGEIEKSTTNSSRDFNELAQTLRELGNKTWVMDKDAILRTFAMDPNPNKTKEQAFEKHMADFAKDGGAELISQLGYGDKQQLFQGLMSDENNPFSLAIPGTTVEGNVGLINPADPDKPIHDMFFPYMMEKGISMEEYNQFINTHEAGHANDRRNHGRENWHRHRTECVADTFATLMLARKTGNTEIGKLASDVRNEFTVQGFAYIQKHLDEQKAATKGLKVALPSELSESLSKFADKDFENREYVGNSALKKFIEEQKQSKTGFTTRKKEPSFVDLHIRDFNGGLSSSAEEGFGRTPEDVLGMIIAYTTTPTVDATIKVAEEKLKDGSLQKMSTKDLYSLAEKMVDENSYSGERIGVMISSFMKGEKTPEVEEILKRKENSGLTTTDHKKVQAAEMTASQKSSYDRNFRSKIESDSKEAVMDAVEKEKDRLRKIDPFKESYSKVHSKIDHLNKKYVEGNSTSRDEVKAKIQDIKDRTLAKKVIKQQQPNVADLVSQKKTR